MFAMDLASLRLHDSAFDRGLTLLTTISGSRSRSELPKPSYHSGASPRISARKREKRSAFLKTPRRRSSNFLPSIARKFFVDHSRRSRPKMPICTDWGCPDLTDSGLGVKNPRSPHENADQ